MSFIQMFRSAGADDEGDEQQQEYRRPAWFGPPEEELGAVVPLGLVVGRSEQAVIALSHVVVHSTGVAFEVTALARGLADADANRLFHEQHLFDEQGEPPEAFLRFGLELPGGARVSNLAGRAARRRYTSPDVEPDGPVFVQHGGGGGSAGGGRISMRPGYWLWPLPQPGPIGIVVEWPALGVSLSRAALDGAELVAAVERVVPLWPTP